MGRDLDRSSEIASDCNHGTTVDIQTEVNYSIMDMADSNRFIFFMINKLVF